MPQLGPVAAAEYGIDLARLALVPAPGPDWPSVVATLIDGFDLVVVETAGPVDGNLMQRLAARARQRGTVLIITAAWSGCDVTIDRRWEGIADGRGRLRQQTVTFALLAGPRGPNPADPNPDATTLRHAGFWTSKLHPDRRVNPGSSQLSP